MNVTVWLICKTFWFLQYLHSLTTQVVNKELGPRKWYICGSQEIWMKAHRNHYVCCKTWSQFCTDLFLQFLRSQNSKQFKIVRYSNLDSQARGGKTVYVLPKLVIFFQTDLALNNIGQMITKDHIPYSNIPWARIRTNLLFDVACVWNSKIPSITVYSVTQTPFRL